MPQGKSPGGTCLPIAAGVKTEGILRGDKRVQIPLCALCEA